MMRILALVLTVLTGFSGLVYEVTWQKGLAILLGSHSEATAAVLAIFLGGLSVGYSLFGHVSSRITASAGVAGAGRRLLLLYGVIEAGIGAYRDAGPVSGNVPPITIVRAVIPVSDEADVAPEAVTPSTTMSAAAKSTTFLIRTPSGDGAVWSARLSAPSPICHS